MNIQWAYTRVIAAIAATIMLIAPDKRAEAVLMPNGSDDTSYRTLGSQYQGRLLSLKILVPGIGTGERNGSAVYLNSKYALTAAHNVADLLQFNPTYKIGTGENYKTDPGTVVEVSGVTIHPSYVGGFPKNYIDLAILHFAEPLDGESASIKSVAVGDIITSVGFGAAGTPATGLDLPRDGFSRGWVSAVDDFFAVDVSDTYYFNTFFGSSSGVSLNGRGASGDSGGPAFDLAGNLVGITVAGSPTSASTVGLTYYLDLSQPEISSWIRQNTTVPEPGTIALTSLGSALFAFRRRRVSSSPDTKDSQWCK